MRIKIALLIALVLPGCIALPAGESCLTPRGWIVTGPPGEGQILPAFQSDEFTMLSAVQNSADTDAGLRHWFGTAGNQYPNFTIDGNLLHSMPGRFAPTETLLTSFVPNFDPADQSPSGRWTYESRLELKREGDSDACVKDAALRENFEFEDGTRGETAYPGIGVEVLTAGFWYNGTLFYTNMDRVHNDTRIARGGWYEFENGDPLRVYVYNNTRTELPPRYNQSGFGTTIPGFNKALDQLFVGTSKVAALRAEDAYTRPGNENHALYGDKIVFYIEITDVVAIDCPYPRPVCEVPTVPPGSHAEDRQVSKSGPPV